MSKEQEATIKSICDHVKLEGYTAEQCDYIRKVFTERKLNTDDGWVFVAVSSIEPYVTLRFSNAAANNTKDENIRQKAEAVVNATSCLSYIEAIFEFLEAVE